MESIIECTSSLVTEFVEELERDGVLQDTRVIILGDHLSMPNVLHDRLEKVERREIFNLWLGAPERRPLHPTMLHYDFLASTLDFIGVKASSGRVGLGASAFSEPNYASRDAVVEAMTRDLSVQSPEYLSLWW